MKSLSRREAALVREMKRRILRHWEAATAADLATGLEWYERAADVARALEAGTESVSFESAAGVIAALSPRNAWSSNVKGATAFVDAFAKGEPQPLVAGTLSNRRKAWEILERSGDPLEVLGGPKVRAFYANITGDLFKVTVDVWACRAAEGSRCRDAAPNGRRYQLIELAYQQAADVVGHAPRDVQAAVWVYFRRVTSGVID